MHVQLKWDTTAFFRIRRITVSKKGEDSDRMKHGFGVFYTTREGQTESIDEALNQLMIDVDTNKKRRASDA